MMEAAAETVRQLSRTILPERPHQLAQDPDWRSRYSPDDNSRRLEEWYDTRLQYMTFLSDADRGTLFTRGYYDIRQEPPRPVPKEVDALARAAAPKKTLSLSDYKNKKTSTPSATTPTHTPTKSTPGADRATSTPAPESKPATQMDHTKKSDAGRSSGSEARSKGSNDLAASMRLPPKPPAKPTLPAKPPTPESRKRIADTDDGARPLKRPKPTDTGRPSDDRSHGSRDDAHRRRTQDAAHGRDSLSNGRARPSSTTSASRGTSPTSRSRGNSVNGVRNTLAESNHSTPSKGDSFKSSVPPLLSPLRLNIDGDRDDYQARRAEKKRRENGADATTKTTTKPSTKRPSSPKLPPLLSPGLPSEVEAELERRKRPSPKPGSKERDDTIHIKRSAERPREKVNGGKELGSRMVTLKIPKSQRAKFRLLMKLSPRKETQWSDRPSSASGVGAQPARAEKRPSTHPEQSFESKKSRSSEMSASTKGPMPPSTPSKKGAAAMSRVSSSNSTIRTPGVLTASTPTVPGSSERGGAPHRSSESGGPSLKDKEEALNKLGISQKRLGDSALKNRPDPGGATNGNGRQGEAANQAIGFVYILESLAAFIAGFNAQDTRRTMANRSGDPSIWQSVFPLIEMLQKETRRVDQHRFHLLYTLSLPLQAMSYARLLSSWATHEDPSDRITIKHFIRFERSRARAWTLFREANDTLSESLRLYITQWATVDEVVESTLRVLSLWCAEEGIDWSPHPKFKEAGIRTSSRG